MKRLDRGPAFGAGMVLAPAILWTIVVVARTVFLGVVTHLFWILSVPAARLTQRPSPLKSAHIP
jgi:hypothetical protein